MLDFIIEYWVGFVLAGAGTILTLWLKRVVKLEKDSLEKKQEEFKEEIVKETDAKLLKDLTEINNNLNNEIQRSSEIDSNLAANLDTLTSGMLSLQGRQFKESCKALLEPTYVLTAEDIDEITKEHDTYNALGGNHRGDALYAAIIEKYHASFSSTIDGN